MSVWKYNNKKKKIKYLQGLDGSLACLSVCKLFVSNVHQENRFCRMIWSHFNNKQSIYEKKKLYQKYLEEAFEFCWLAVMAINLLHYYLFIFYYNTLPHACHLAVNFQLTPPWSPGWRRRARARRCPSAPGCCTRSWSSLWWSAASRCCCTWWAWSCSSSLPPTCNRRRAGPEGTWGNPLKTKENNKQGVEDGQSSFDLAVPPGGSVIIRSKGINS